MLIQKFFFGVSSLSIAKLPYYNEEFEVFDWSNVTWLKFRRKLKVLCMFILSGLGRKTFFWRGFFYNIWKIKEYYCVFTIDIIFFLWWNTIVLSVSCHLDQFIPSPIQTDHGFETWKIVSPSEYSQTCLGSVIQSL